MREEWSRKEEGSKMRGIYIINIAPQEYINPSLNRRCCIWEIYIRS
jgi:hypothetical protein